MVVIEATGNNSFLSVEANKANSIYLFITHMQGSRISESDVIIKKWHVPAGRVKVTRSVRK